MLTLGLAWSSKESFPSYTTHIAHILNLGTVKEGQRILLGGIPWKIDHINFVSRLSNPDLEGGVIKVPLKILIGSYSRQAVNDEPWFPTKIGDKVILKDNTVGVVTMQTPEVVKIVDDSGSVTIFPSSEFIKMGMRIIRKDDYLEL